MPFDLTQAIKTAISDLRSKDAVLADYWQKINPPKYIRLNEKKLELSEDGKTNWQKLGEFLIEDSPTGKRIIFVDRNGKRYNVQNSQDMDELVRRLAKIFISKGLTI